MHQEPAPMARSPFHSGACLPFRDASDVWCELKIEQVSKSHGRTPQLKVEPTTEIVQAHFGGETSAKANKRMESVGGEAKGQVQFAGDGFNHLADGVHEAPPAGRGLGHLGATV